jgi:hypothetical protein
MLECSRINLHNLSVWQSLFCPQTKGYCVFNRLTLSGRTF